MAFTHGKVSFCSLDSVDLSTYTNSIEWANTADSHDVTTFGKDAHTYQAGLTDGTATLAGIYDSGVGGPRATIEPLIGGDAVVLVYRPEGTGSSLPERSVDVIITSYSESAPVADMVSWTCELQLSDDIDTTAQGA